MNATKKMSELQPKDLFKLNKNSYVYMCIEGVKGDRNSVAYRRADSSTNRLSVVRPYHSKWDKEVEIVKFY